MKSQRTVMLEAKVAQLRQDLGETHHTVLATEMELGESYAADGDYDSAYRQSSETLSKYRNLYGSTHKSTLVAMLFAGNIWAATGYVEDSAKAHAYVLDVWSNEYNRIEAYLLIGDSMFLESLMVLNRFDQALAVCTEVINTFEERFGVNHDKTIKSRDDMVLILKQLGRVKEALVLEEYVVMSIVERADSDPSVISQRLNDLAETNWQLGNHERAISILKKRGSFLQGRVGERSQEYMANLANTAMLLRNLGRFQESLKLSKQALSLHHGNPESQESDVLMAEWNMAYTLTNLGRFGEALELHRKVAARYLALEGYTQQTLNSMAGYASCLGTSGERLLQIREFEKIAEKSMRSLGEGSPFTYRMIRELGLACEKHGDKDIALRHYWDSYRGQCRLLGAAHPIAVGVKADIDRIGSHS